MAKLLHLAIHMDRSSILNLLHLDLPLHCKATGRLDHKFLRCNVRTHHHRRLPLYHRIEVQVASKLLKYRLHV